MNSYSIANIMAVLAIGMLLLAILIVACGPAAQTDQESATPAAGNPAPTDAPTLAADTPTPPATWEPEPTPVILPAYDYPKLDEMLDLQVAVYQTQQSSVSGQAEPRAFEVYIWTHGPTQREEVASFLDNHDIAHIKPITYPGTRSKENDISATIPVSLLSSLNAQPGVMGVEIREMPYPSMDERLNELASQYAAGLMPNHDTNPTFTFLTIVIDRKENFDAVRSFLKNNEGIMKYTDQEADELYSYTGQLIAFVPVAQLVPLARMAGVNFLQSEMWPVRFVPSDPASSPTPETRNGVPPSSDGATGLAAATIAPTATPVSAIIHGADAWHTAET